MLPAPKDMWLDLHLFLCTQWPRDFHWPPCSSLRVQKGKAPSWTPLPPGNGLGGINLQFPLGLVSLQKQGQGCSCGPRRCWCVGASPAGSTGLGEVGWVPGKAVHASARADCVMVFLPLGAPCGFYRTSVLFSLVFLPSP